MARRIRWQIVIAALSSLLVVALLSGLALSNTAVSEPLAGGTYTEVVLDTPRQLLPLFNDPLTDPVGRDIAALLFDGLTRPGVNGLPAAALAESWQIDQTGAVYTFRLRRDVTWHDGEPFDADDVVFTLRAIQDEAFPGDATQANLWRTVLVDRIDDHTVRCTLDAPYAPFLSLTQVAILPEHLLGDTPVADWPDLAFASQPVGTGPFRFGELAPDHALLTANPDYFEQSAIIDRIELRFTDSAQAGMAVLLRGEANALGSELLAQPDLSQPDLPSSLRRIRVPLDGYTMLTFNLHNSLLKNQALRRALARGLDKETLIDQALGGQAQRVDTPILPGSWAYDASVQWHDYDPDAAAQLLEQLGYALQSDGIRLDDDDEPLVLPLLTDEDPAHLAAAEEIARQWGEIGVTVEVSPLDSATLRERLHDRDFVLALHSWSRLGSDPDMYELWHSSQAEEGLNYAGLEDETIDKLLTSGRTQPDPVERRQDYGAFQSRWTELTPGILLYQPIYTFAASEELGGLGFELADPPHHQVLLIGREDRYRTMTSWFVNRTRELPGTLQ